MQLLFEPGLQNLHTCHIRKVLINFSTSNGKRKKSIEKTTEV